MIRKKKRQVPKEAKIEKKTIFFSELQKKAWNDFMNVDLFEPKWPWEMVKV